jgi:MYND finger
MTAGTSTATRWSGLETSGMKEAHCSLLLQDEETFDAKIKALPPQRVIVYQDKGFNPAASSSDDNYFVDFKGATILQLEPQAANTTMPVTMTVAGRCVFTPENYQDFRVMMRTKDQSQEMEIAPNGAFDWPDVTALLTCPCCGQVTSLPQSGERMPHEFWMVFYPLLQITVIKGTQLTLGTRTVCRLTCLDCMDDLLEGLALTIQPGKPRNSNIYNGATTSTTKIRTSRLCFTLPAADVLAEAGSASFLEDGPPRPDTHPHVDDILDAWTLYNLWEHSGAWEALQNDYRIVLSRSMHADASCNNSNNNNNNNSDHNTATSTTSSTNNAAQTVASGAIDSTPNPEARLKERLGKPCGNRECHKVHGRVDTATREITRLAIKCQLCLSEFYCSKSCRDACQDTHAQECVRKQKDREERRERKAKKVECDTCHSKFAYTKMKKCSRCRRVTYCSVECQKSDWNDRHRYECQPVAR